MRIGIVTTHPRSRCAIGKYSQHLAARLTRLDDTEVMIVAERGTADEGADTVPVRTCYSRRGVYASAILDALRSTRCDVMHVQYAPDLFGEDERLPRMLRSARRAGLRTAVTLHTVYRARARRRHVDRFHRAIGTAADLVVVHHRGMANVLGEHGVDPRRIRVIPHGTDQPTLPDAVESRRALGLPLDRTLLTFFGFIHLQKNVHTLIEAFLRAAERAPRAILLIAGMPWGDRWYNHIYTAALKVRVMASAHRSRIWVRDRYVPPHDVPRLFAASDALVLPHHQGYESASGVFHQAIGARRAVLCARGPKFEDAQELFQSSPELTVPPTDVEAWARSIARIATDATWRDACRSLVADYAEHTAWPRIAERHRSAYGEL